LKQLQILALEGAHLLCHRLALLAHARVSALDRAQLRFQVCSTLNGSICVAARSLRHRRLRLARVAHA